MVCLTCELLHVMPLWWPDAGPEGDDKPAAAALFAGFGENKNKNTCFKNVASEEHPMVWKKKM